MAINPDDLRAVADFLDDKPELQANLTLGVSAYLWDKDRWQALLNELGTFEKDASGSSLWAVRRFGAAKIELMVSKEETCVRRQVGTRKVTKEVYPETVKPVVEETEEPVYEWLCPETWKPREG